MLIYDIIEKKNNKQLQLIFILFYNNDHDSCNHWHIQTFELDFIPIHAFKIYFKHVFN